MSVPSRLVRVFISSTFRDFMGERDELVRKVFPELRRRCRARFVELLEVDLRWGITEEQSRQGATLKICLQEIDRCRPSSPVFFIGLLGERYGWVPEAGHYPRDVLEDPGLSWVKEHVGGRSVTELEILHGVLNNPAMASRALFYFRRDGYEQRHWAGIQAAYPDLRPSDFTNAGQSDPAMARGKQEALKQRVRAAGLKHAPRDYETPAEAAGLILEALWGEIDATFPASEVPDALEQETMDHQVFCESRTRAYVEREGLFAALDAHAEGVGPAGRVVLGESGSGKSALLAAWLERCRDRVVFCHFTGATPGSVTAEGLLRRLFGVLQGRGVLPRTVRPPADAAALAASVPSWLEQLAQAGGGVILLDALNQLASAADRGLAWWPLAWPENVRVVFSTLPGEVWRELQRRGWTTEAWRLNVPPLQPDEKKSIMDLYLRRFARNLEPRLQQRLLAAEQAANPLFLRTVLDELRLRSRHEDLDRNLDILLRCGTPAELFVQVLQNLERDFTPGEHPGLVHRALGLLGVGKRGLTEGELLELLSPAAKPARGPLPRHYWAPLYLALEDSLVSREGQLTFFHDYLRQAVWLEYLDEAEERAAAHGRLAEPAIRWRETDAFGSGLRAYGFAHGIGHLLAVGRSGEARDLVLDRDYQNAAAVALRDPGPVERDVAAVRRTLALAGNLEPAVAAELAAQTLLVRPRLTRHLRQVLDDAARQGDWEEVMALAAAGADESERLLLACRALVRGGRPGEGQAAADLRALLARWSTAAGKEEWTELTGRLLPAPAADSPPN
jgi:hypothetical protein